MEVRGTLMPGSMWHHMQHNPIESLSMNTQCFHVVFSCKWPVAAFVDWQNSGTGKHNDEKNNVSTLALPNLEKM